MSWLDNLLFGYRTIAGDNNVDALQRDRVQFKGATVTDVAGTTVVQYPTGSGTSAAGVDTLADLRAVASADRADKQFRLVEATGRIWRFDSAAGANVADDGQYVIKPNDVLLSAAGRWFAEAPLSNNLVGASLVQVNHSVITPGSPVAAPSSIVGLTVDRGDAAGVKRDRAAMVWDESASAWRAGLTSNDTSITTAAALMAASIALGTSALMPITGLVRTPNNTTIVTARNAANTADIAVLATNATNDTIVGDGTNGGWVYLKATGGGGIEFDLGASNYLRLTAAGLTLANTGMSLFGGITFLDGVTPTITQTQKASGAGADTTAAAQQGSSGNAGGRFVLAGGDHGTPASNRRQDVVLDGGSIISNGSAGLVIRAGGTDQSRIRYDSNGGVAGPATYIESVTSGVGFAVNVSGNIRLVCSGASTLSLSTASTMSFTANPSITSSVASFIIVDRATANEAFRVTPLSAGATALQFAATVTNAKILQPEHASGAGNPMWFVAQNAKTGTTNNGGDLVLFGGLSAGTATGGWVTVSSVCDSGFVSSTVSGLWLKNTTAASSSEGGGTLHLAQFSPPIKFSGAAWDTGAVASRSSDWLFQNVPVSGNPITSTFLFQSQLNGGGFTTQMSISSGGVVAATTAVAVGASVGTSGGLRLTQGSTTGISFGAATNIINYASSVLNIGATGTNIIANGDDVALKYQGTTRIEIDSTGIGFFSHATSAKPTVTGAKGSNAALGSLMTALSGLGLVTDSTSA